VHTYIHTPYMCLCGNSCRLMPAGMLNAACFVPCALQPLWNGNQLDWCPNAEPIGLVPQCRAPLRVGQEPENCDIPDWILLYDMKAQILRGVAVTLSRNAKRGFHEFSESPRNHLINASSVAWISVQRLAAQEQPPSFLYKLCNTASVLGL
jgi:hypothetical protein